MGPGAHPQGHGAPQLFDGVIPCPAAMTGDVFARCEDPVREPVVPDELPDVPGGVQFGRAGLSGCRSDFSGLRGFADMCRPARSRTGTAGAPGATAAPIFAAWACMAGLPAQGVSRPARPPRGSRSCRSRTQPAARRGAGALPRPATDTGDRCRIRVRWRAIATPCVRGRWRMASSGRREIGQRLARAHAGEKAREGRCRRAGQPDHAGRPGAHPHRRHLRGHPGQTKHAGRPGRQSDLAGRRSRRASGTRWGDGKGTATQASGHSVRT